MTQAAIHSSAPDNCTLWTPWGPQVTEPVDARLAFVRRALRKVAVRQEKLGSTPKDESAKPECAYDP